MVKRVALAVEALYPEPVSPAMSEAIARAAIEAMREPTGEMIRATYDSHGKLWAENEATDVWRAMANAALD